MFPTRVGEEGAGWKEPGDTVDRRNIGIKTETPGEAPSRLYVYR
jgi:hypothetical protein